MALLERISTMKREGKSSQEIIKTLGEEGVSPRQINEALSQSDIKSAVSTEENMQPSIMQTTDQTAVGMSNSSEANQETSVACVYPASGSQNDVLRGLRFRENTNTLSPRLGYQEPQACVVQRTTPRCSSGYRGPEQIQR